MARPALEATAPCVTHHHKLLLILSGRVGLHAVGCSRGLLRQRSHVLRLTPLFRLAKPQALVYAGLSFFLALVFDEESI